ncbi:DHHA1 domain-containing protein [Halothiobacillus sp.]|jgi:oligoribonuclease NrnB/cAMP/cGMP phosphodiesterase (DHH superfamily)|uniref:DHHA1 domain-containing protein n=1 Tax=Halothiobacillus sp. TaxID=1891311 RepID=UPI0029861B29|nr:DHHA1 domain-containing protein [Halothiobacillus sp.]MDY0147389.1 DHHA1 domain-containing protein [Halothiobacillus sp.]
MSTPKLIRPQHSQDNAAEGWVYHLSHTDLDGYGAQFMLKAAGVNTRCFNADYRDIPLAVDKIVEQIIEEGEPASLLLTDLNLTLDQAEQIDKRIKKLKVPTTLQLLDHHATGADCAAKFDWYYLDTERCATKLAFEAVADLMPEDQRAQYALRADFVDMGDRWLKDEPLFRKSLYLLGLVMQDDHLAPPLADIKRSYRFHVIEHFFQAHERGENLESIERGLYDVRKNFLVGRIDAQDLNNPELPLNDKFHILSASVLDETTVPMLDIDGVRTGIFFNWPHDVWRGVIMDMMETRHKMDMAIGVRGNGKLSLRANPGVDAGAISAKYFRGGGHPGAAGGELRDNRLRDLDHAVSSIKQTINPAPPVATAKLGSMITIQPPRKGAQKK